MRVRVQMLIEVKRLRPANATRLGTTQASLRIIKRYSKNRPVLQLLGALCLPGDGQYIKSSEVVKPRLLRLLNGNYLAIANLIVPQDDTLQINEESVS